MKKTLKRSLVMILATVLLIGTFAVTADAAMKRTVNKQSFTTKTSTANKKSATVKKGTTTLTYKKGEGYIKFVAPKTKKYTFTFSDYKLKGTTCGHIGIMMKDKDFPTSVTFTEASTKGGKSDTLWMCSAGFPETKTGKTVDRYLHKRLATIKLKKGEVIYFYFYSVAKQKTTMKLVIK